MDMAGGVIGRLPRSGGFPFEPKRGQSLDNPGSITKKDGMPEDKHGDQWRWDPIKGEFDVQHKNGTHTNIGPDGNVTHGGDKNMGRDPKPSDDEGGASFIVVPDWARNIQVATPSRQQAVAVGAAGAVGFALLHMVAVA